MKFKKPRSLLLAAVLLCAFAVPLLETPALAADKEIHEVATAGVYKWITITAGEGGAVTEVVQTGGVLPPGMSLGKNEDVSSLFGTPTTPGTYILTGETHYEDNAASWVLRWKVRLFVDVATGWAWCAWRFLSPDGKTEVIFDVTADKFPGLTITGGNSTTMYLTNIPLELNGWKAVCLFSSATNLWTYTDGTAVITVNAAATPTPSPTPEPTATPEPDRPCRGCRAAPRRRHHGGSTACAEKETARGIRTSGAPETARFCGGCRNGGLPTLRARG